LRFALAGAIGSSASGEDALDLVKTTLPVGPRPKLAIAPFPAYPTVKFLSLEGVQPMPRTKKLARPTVSAPAPQVVSDGLLRVPAPTANQLDLRFASLADRDNFDPSLWRSEPLRHSFDLEGFYEIDLDALSLADGAYEYELVLDGRTDNPIADPFAEEITRFSGYRGIFRIASGRRVRQRFSWDGELPAGVRLPDNNQIVIYELPIRWMDNAPDDSGFRQVDVGTFESTLFSHLDDLAQLGVNTLELLPIQDSPDTLNWGYATRFFFAPDLGMGVPMDLKFLIKQCHRRGIRVFLDVVMNHSSTQCPLLALAADWFYLPVGSQEEGDRPEYGGRLFRYVRPAPDGNHPAREFHCRMAEFWVREYHVDGFRIDEFKGINNWDFIQEFRERAWAAHRQLFPDRPFLVIAEDSWRRAVITQNDPNNPNGRQVVDAMWNFAYRDDLRRLLRDGIDTRWGEPARRDRIRALVSDQAMWDELSRQMKRGFSDLAQSVIYQTSHDVEKEEEERYMNYVFGGLLRERGLGDGSTVNVRALVDDIEHQSSAIQQAHDDALDRVRSAFALLLTSAGVPMFLAGEEFADVHDLDHGDYRLKMSDPVDWERRKRPGHQFLWDRVRELIALRTTHSALQRDEVEFFYFHPAIDDNGGARVFAYCRSGGLPLGSRNQVVVVANAGPQSFTDFRLPWPWAESSRLQERAARAQAGQARFPTPERQAILALAPFQVRVFST
jgi:1,4-alpha-glucan branching enzyme